MKYVEFTPSPALRHLVERLWVLEVNAAEPRLDPILPDGRPEIIVHCGAPFAALEADGAVRVQERVLLSGQLRRAKHVAPMGAGLAAGATLRPHGAAALFGVPQHELTDRIVELGAVDRALARTIRDDVVGRSDPRAIAAAFDRALVGRAARQTGESAAARAAALALEARGLVRVERLAEHVGLSRRHLERAFQQEIGLTPKQLLRVARFQETLNALREPRTGWADFAVSLGYYDQAHFVNDFKHFTGQPPGAWQIDDQSLTAVFSTGRRPLD